MSPYTVSYRMSVRGQAEENMQSDNAIYEVINRLYGANPDTTAKAVLLVAALLLDIRAQNQRMMELLQKR